jgi:hypothetical protein
MVIKSRGAHSDAIGSEEEGRPEAEKDIIDGSEKQHLENKKGSKMSRKKLQTAKNKSPQPAAEPAKSAEAPLEGIVDASGEMVALTEQDIAAR